jgi:hypothetical protein
MGQEAEMVGERDIDTDARNKVLSQLRFGLTAALGRAQVAESNGDGAEHESAMCVARHFEQAMSLVIAAPMPAKE